MLKQNRIIKAFRNQRGASLVFVLGIMTLLLVISVSVLVAAGSNYNSSANMISQNQLSIIADSVQRNILYSLQNNPESNDSMSEKLVLAVYEKNKAVGGNESPDDIELIMEFEDGFDLVLENSGVTVASIILSFPQNMQRVLVDKAVPYVPAAPAVIVDGVEVIPAFDEVPGKPRSAEVSAEMTATVKLSAFGKSITTRALYKYTNGKLISSVPESTDENVQMSFDVDEEGNVECGEWTLVNYEKVDVQY